MSKINDFMGSAAVVAISAGLLAGCYKLYQSITAPVLPIAKVRGLDLGKSCKQTLKRMRDAEKALLAEKYRAISEYNHARGMAFASRVFSNAGMLTAFSLFAVISYPQLSVLWEHSSSNPQKAVLLGGSLIVFLPLSWNIVNQGGKVVRSWPVLPRGLEESDVSILSAQKILALFAGAAVVGAGARYCGAPLPEIGIGSLVPTPKTI